MFVLVPNFTQIRQDHHSQVITHSILSSSILRRGLILPLLLSAQFLVGCGANPTMLKHPSKLQDDRGIAFGRIHVSRGDSDVTGACYLEFEDDKDELTGTYNLDKDGWFFAALPKTRNSIRLVRCAVMFGLFYHADELYFDVPRDGKSAYLGDIELKTDQDNVESVPGVAGSPTLQGGLSSVALAQTPSVIKSDDDVAVVRNKMDEAIREYEKRFGEKPQLAESVPAGSTEGAPASVE